MRLRWRLLPSASLLVSRGKSRGAFLLILFFSMMFMGGNRSIYGHIDLLGKGSTSLLEDVGDE